MREIKFRAWDVVNKKIIEDVSVGSEYVEYDQEQYGTYKEFIPMQFVELKDKNDKDIYEGDIVEKETVRIDRNLPTLKERFIVKFLDGCFYMHSFWYSEDIYNMPTNDDGTPQYLDDQIFWHEDGKDMTVLGNIYENPDLL